MCVCICSSGFRSSFLLQLPSTALQTVLISAQRMTAPSCSQRPDPAAPAHAGPNTATVTAAATAAAGRAAPITPKWRLQTLLTSAPLQQRKATPQANRQGAAAVRVLLLRIRKKGSEVHLSRILCLLFCISTTECFLLWKCTTSDAILFRNNHLV